MAKEMIKSADSPSPPNTTSSTTQPGKLEATTVDLSADSVQVHHFPAALRRRRSLRRRSFRVTHKAAHDSIPRVHSNLVDSELIPILLLKPKLVSSHVQLREEADVDDEPQVVDPKVKRLRITGPTFETDKVIDPFKDPDTRRLRILANICYDRLLALGDDSSPSNNYLRKS